MASRPAPRTPHASSARVAAKRAAFRGKILDAAERIVEKGGLEALTVKRLARDLGVALGGIYHYFGGIDDVLVALAQRAIEGLGAAIRRADAAGAPAIDRLAAAIAVFVDAATREPARHRLVDALVSSQERIFSASRARAAERGLAAILAQVAGLFEAAVAEGALASGDAEVRTHLVWAALHGLDHFRKRDARAPHKLRHRALLAEMLVALFTSFGARPTAVRTSFGLRAAPPRSLGSRQPSSATHSRRTRA